MPPLRLRPDLEEALSRILGVTAVSVITSGDGRPTEIHVLGSPGRHAKQIVRDVQSLAMAQFDLDLDHRIVSVVQLDDVAVAAAVAAPAGHVDGANSGPSTDDPFAEDQFADVAHLEPLAPAESMASAHSVPFPADEVIDLRDREPVALSVVGSDRFDSAPAPVPTGSVGHASHPLNDAPANGSALNGSTLNGSALTGHAPSGINGGRHAATARVMLLPEALAAEAASDDEPAPRPAIASIMVRTSNGESEATVAVGAGGHMFEGRVVGPAGATHRARLVAQATLAAVADLLGQAAEIESAQLVAAGARSVAVTVLTIQTPRIGEQVMSGSAMVRGDDADAVARSVLDALNRRISG